MPTGIVLVAILLVVMSLSVIAGSSRVQPTTGSISNSAAQDVETKAYKLGFCDGVRAAIQALPAGARRQYQDLPTVPAGPCGDD